MAVTRGRLFRVSRFFVRPLLGRWTCDIPAPQGPTVYVAHHGNMRGPITTLCYLPFPVRPWVLHTLTRRDTCYVQYRDVTFLGRLGYPRPLAAALAWVTSRYVSAVTQSMGAIPVYRGTVKIGRTFQASVEALQAGEPILLFPDIDYAHRGGEIGAVYEGFFAAGPLLAEGLGGAPGLRPPAVGPGDPAHYRRGAGPLRPRRQPAGGDGPGAGGPP